MLEKSNLSYDKNNDIIPNDEDYNYSVKNENKSLSDVYLERNTEEFEFNTDFALSMLQNFQEMDEFEDWNLKVDYPQVRVWVAKRGSFLNRKLPFLH